MKFIEIAFLYEIFECIEKHITSTNIIKYRCKAFIIANIQLQIILHCLLGRFWKMSELYLLINTYDNYEAEAIEGMFGYTTIQTTITVLCLFIT